ncbi:MAG: oxygen-independent coproporphyrinogen III oxidase [Verrucomicrobia bacterium]|nr:oxygen-independent coproporphyrinogen III oxidase [Verrucomicrobiota bacterium]MDA1066897.1 oxygen-independent coproporphyrinogen III oxidase [Verrucomicrobiota bacterium]
MSNFDFAEDAECSVEIDPRVLTKQKVEAFRRLGVNRASIGVQDVNPKVQIAIHRIQPSETNIQAIKWLRDVGITNLNVDLIYGLPMQTVESFSRTLEEVLQYDADRFAVFSYAHVPWSKPAQKILENSGIPTADEKMDMLKTSLNQFVEAGYSHIGMDHFTKPTDTLARAQKSKTLQRNFQGYSLHKDAQICGFGISAISQSRKRYRQNFKDLETYYEFLDAGKCPVERGYLMSKEDRTRRTVIMRLMCDMGLDFEQLSQELGFDFKKHFHKELQKLQPLEKDGLVSLTETTLKVSTLGRLLIRNIATVFDAYFDKTGGGFSKAV